MGLALHGDRLAIGTTVQVWEYVDVPAVTAKLEPAGRHDACFLPRDCHVTGNIQIHEMAWGAGEELWVVNTRFSCLCTIDRSASFTPRWRPPFVTALEPTDRCHLNGLGMVDGRPRYVTALGQTDAPAGCGRTRPRRDPDGRRQRRADGAGAVDAAFAAMVRGAAVGLRVGRRDDRFPRPAHRAVRGRRRRRRGSPAGWTSPATWHSSGSRRCARRPSSAASRSPNGSPPRSGPAASAWSTSPGASRSPSCVSRRACRRSSPCRCSPRRSPELINDDAKLLENSFVVPDAALADVPAALRGRPFPAPIAGGQRRDVRRSRAGFASKGIGRAYPPDVRSGQAGIPDHRAVW